MMPRVSGEQMIAELRKHPEKRNQRRGGHIEPVAADQLGGMYASRRYAGLALIGEKISPRRRGGTENAASR